LRARRSRVSSAQTVACDQTRAPCAVGTASLLRSRANGVGSLALRALSHNAGHHVVWHRSWSAEDGAMVHGLAHRCAGVNPHLGDGNHWDATPQRRELLNF
jgi:hypothetical protein